MQATISNRCLCSPHDGTYSQTPRPLDGESIRRPHSWPAFSKSSTAVSSSRTLTTRLPILEEFRRKLVHGHRLGHLASCASYRPFHLPFCWRSSIPFRFPPPHSCSPRRRTLLQLPGHVRQAQVRLREHVARIPYMFRSTIFWMRSKRPGCLGDFPLRAGAPSRTREAPRRHFPAHLPTSRSHALHFYIRCVMTTARRRLLQSPRRMSMVRLGMTPYARNTGLPLHNLSLTRGTLQLFARKVPMAGFVLAKGGGLLPLHSVQRVFADVPGQVVEHETARD